MSDSTLEPKWIFQTSGRRLRDDHLCGPNSRITPMIDIAVFFVVTVDFFVLTRRFLGAFLSGKSVTIALWDDELNVTNNVFPTSFHAASSTTSFVLIQLASVSKKPQCLST